MVTPVFADKNAVLHYVPNLVTVVATYQPTEKNKA
jgi:hypothetical protein